MSEVINETSGYGDKRSYFILSDQLYQVFYYPQSFTSHLYFLLMEILMQILAAERLCSGQCSEWFNRVTGSAATHVLSVMELSGDGIGEERSCESHNLKCQALHAQRYIKKRQHAQALD